jgi:hypothetical protein
MLAGPWPVGPTLLPGGTIISAVVGPDGKLVFDNASVTAPMPTTVMALDTDSALQMAMWYEERDTINGWHSLHFAPGIDRQAILAQARLNKQWPPNGIPP